MALVRVSGCPCRSFTSATLCSSTGRPSCKHDPKARRPSPGQYPLVVAALPRVVRSPRVPALDAHVPTVSVNEQKILCAARPPLHIIPCDAPSKSDADRAALPSDHIGGRICPRVPLCMQKP
eukprot:2182220-Prymnesium_polylepis.2